MGDEYEVTFLAKDPNASTSATVAGFLEGVEIVRYFLDTFAEEKQASFALTVANDVPDGPQPSLLVEGTSDGNVILQVFAPKEMSPEDEEGWYNVMEPKNHDSFSERDISTIWQRADRTGMVETRLSEGVLFAKKMYVPVEMALDCVNHLLEVRDLRTALADKAWKYVGMI